MTISNILLIIEYTIIGVGIVILAYGAVDSAIRWLISLFKSADINKQIKGSRIVKEHLGTYILLSLEYFIAADILRTIIKPTWEDIGLLAAIVGIRTVLSLFLNMELKYFK